LPVRVWGEMRARLPGVPRLIPAVDRGAIRTDIAVTDAISLAGSLGRRESGNAGCVRAKGANEMMFLAKFQPFSKTFLYAARRGPLARRAFQSDSLSFMNNL